LRRIGENRSEILPLAGRRPIKRVVESQQARFRKFVDRVTREIVQVAADAGAEIVGIEEDPVEACSGPVRPRGDISVVATDVFKDEVRKRGTLCCCGGPANKPYFAAARM
jgi:hypothetical protein